MTPHTSVLEQMLTEIVDAAIAVEAADFGHFDLLGVDGALRACAQRGVPPEWAASCESVGATEDLCRTALARGKRVVVADVARSPLFAKPPAREVLLRVGVGAVQATPLIGRGGTAVGAFVTYHLTPHRPNGSTPRLLDMLARQAALLIEREQTDVTLRESQQRLAATHQSAPIGIVELTLDGVYVGVNDEFCRIVGYARDELLGRSFADLTYGEDLPRNFELFRRLTAGEIPAFQFEKRFVRKDGTLVWVQVNRTLVSDDVGTPLYVVGAILDITGRRESEDALRESEERFRVLTATIPQLVWETDADGLCTFQSPQWTRWTGQRSETSLGMGWLQVIHPDDRHRAASVWKIAHEHGHVYETEYRLRRADGSYRRCIARAHAQRNASGEVARWVGTTTDIDDMRRAEEALRENQATLQSFYDSAPMLMGIAELDGDGTVAVSGNKAVATYLNTTPEALAGRRGLVFGTPTELERLWVDSYRRTQQSGMPERFEYKHQHTTGDTWLSATVAFLGIGPAGRPRFSFVAEDVTARKNAETQLRESEHRLRLAMAASATGMWVWNVVTDVVEWSPECYLIHGMREGEFGGTAAAFNEVVHPDDRERVWTSVRAAVEQQTFYECEFRIVRPNGDVRWVMNVGRVVCDEQGRPVRMVGTLNDITARRESQREREELLRIAERARAEAETSRHMLERVQRIVDVTTGTLPLDDLLEVLGELVQRTLRVDTLRVLLRDVHEEDEDAEEMLRVRATRGLSTIRPHDDVPVGVGFAGIVAATMRPVVWSAVDASALLGDGALRGSGVRSLAGVPLVLEGQLLGVLDVGSKTDRTFTEHDIQLLEIAAERIALGITRSLASRAQAKAVERLEAASASKDNFLAVLSHELRSPLNAILGWVNVIRSGAVSPEKLQDGLARIERNVRLQAELVNDLLDVSRIVSGKLTIERVPLLLDGVVASAVESLRLQAESRGIFLECSAEELHGMVVGDAGRLTQVVVNLVGNALKFTPRGGSVSVSLREREHEADLEVRDTGEGIAAEFLPRLFERFTQADAASNRAHGGLGLGLSIVHFVVKEHGGTVTAASSGKGLGAVFTVRLPLSGLARAVPEKRESSLTGPKLEGVHLLVVDDEDDSREVLGLLLEAEGGRIRTADTARAALEALREERPDILVADIGMPGDDGYWLIDEVRRMDGFRTLPAIALTGFASRQDQLRARAAGYQMHLSKPVDREALVASVAELARGLRRRTRRAAPAGRAPQGDESS